MNSIHRTHWPVMRVFKKITASVWYLFAAILLQSCAGKHVTNYPSLKPVVTTAYCQANLIGKTQSMTQTELDVLENKQRIKDETTIELMLKSAALKIVEESESVKDCQQVFTQGTALFIQKLKENQQIFARKKGFKPAQDSQIAVVQKRITDLWRADQSARVTMIGFPQGDKKGAGFWANRLGSAHTIRVDKEATQYIESLIEQYDWIDQQRFGVPVSAHAWLLIQHADDRVDLQSEVLQRMEPYFKNGGIRPANYAYLWDRVAVNRGQLQRYGTQPIWECKEGQLALQPIEDMEQANQLRAKLDMNTVEAGLAEMSRSVCASQ